MTSFSRCGSRWWHAAPPWTCWRWSVGRPLAKQCAWRAFIHPRTPRRCPCPPVCTQATDEQQLLVNRSISWQNLFTVSPDPKAASSKPKQLAAPQSAISALAWRPDGHTLAVGYGNGELAFYDSESTELRWVRVVPGRDGPSAPASVNEPRCCGATLRACKHGEQQEQTTVPLGPP